MRSPFSEVYRREMALTICLSKTLLFSVSIFFTLIIRFSVLERMKLICIDKYVDSCICLSALHSNIHDQEKYNSVKVKK